MPEEVKLNPYEILDGFKRNPLEVLEHAYDQISNRHEPGDILAMTLLDTMRQLHIPFPFLERRPS